ncbi:hypothetical protein [Actinokineospora sp. UTMC 2448]|uniref:hypothetical protein n=1 Tax=Actinokineospora sp. UTMC 2448 TaxID=2268449 RepID=UPI002164DB99|nr:hypothetical protein [Actinokineospora sp. UTMC 2448]UVS80548.1 hypothetical protein Actkin_04299 [Actinokineospora sp. UTMC 2448]
MTGPTLRAKILATIGLITAAAAAGVLGGLLEESTGHTWLRYLPMIPVIAIAVVLVLRMKKT